MFPISVSDFNSRFHDFAIPRFRDSAISRFRDFTIPRFRDFAIPQFRDSLISRFHDFAIPQVHDSANARFQFRDFAISRFRDFLDDRGGPRLRPYPIPCDPRSTEILVKIYCAGFNGDLSWLPRGGPENICSLQPSNVDVPCTSLVCLDLAGLYI